MNVFRPAETGDIPALRQLWKDAFADDDIYLDVFFQTAFSPRRCRVLTRGGRVCGAAYWLDCSFREEKIAYVYAVAIAPSLQGLGLGTALMDNIHQQLLQDGYRSALLVPGNEGLRQYYRRFGYRTVSWHKEFTVSAGKPVAMEKIDPQHYCRLRRQYLPGNGIVQENENLALLEQLADLFRGEDFLCAVAKAESVCLELLGDPAAAAGITAALHLDRCRFRVPCTDIPFAMGMDLKEPFLPEKLYFGFAFD